MAFTDFSRERVGNELEMNFWKFINCFQDMYFLALEGVLKKARAGGPTHHPILEITG